MRFVIRPAAREDILRQYRYYLIEKDAEDAAERFLDAARVAMEYVSLRPGLGTPKVLKNAALKGLRSLWQREGILCDTYLLPGFRERGSRDSGAPWEEGYREFVGGR